MKLWIDQDIVNGDYVVIQNLRWPYTFMNGKVCKVIGFTRGVADPSFWWKLEFVEPIYRFWTTTHVRAYMRTDPELRPASNLEVLAGTGR